MIAVKWYLGISWLKNDGKTGKDAMQWHLEYMATVLKNWLLSKKYIADIIMYLASCKYSLAIIIINTRIWLYTLIQANMLPNVMTCWTVTLPK